MKPNLWDRVASHLERDISPGQREKLREFRDWLVAEAISSGGLGPDEGPRLEDRHLADSILFYSGWERADPPETIWDLGSGVGLPGIPLAILLPETEVVLVDRSGRRSHLARRAIRVLDLSNVRVHQTDIEELEGVAPMVVSRAALSPGRLHPILPGLLELGGAAVVGGSWVGRPDEVPPGWEIKEIPRDVLDRPLWLLIMRP